MNPVPVLALLGVTTLLPCVQALSCWRGKIETVRQALELPLRWNTSRTACDVGEGCQDLVVLLENGPQIELLISKDCVKVEDHEPRVTWLRRGPGLSIVSYVHVCRHSDFCNNVSSTEVLGDLPTPSVPGTLRCPVCLSKDGCENSLEQVCPAGTTHCYSGDLRFRGAGFTTNLKVQGCTTQPGCDLLNGTQTIGTLDMSENCGLLLEPRALDCYSDTIETVGNVSDLHLRWGSAWKTCAVGNGCFETAMLIQNGQEFHLVVTKGCTDSLNKEVQITRHRTGPGISIVSYIHVCRHRDFCNDLSTTSSLWTPPLPTAPGTLRCPHCLSTRDCENVPQQTCPANSVNCYNGVLRLRGGGVATNLRVQGCTAHVGCNLLDGTTRIGPITLRENCGPQSGSQALECRSGQAEGTSKVSLMPLEWTIGWQACEIGEGCQETALLILNGPVVSLAVTKGCTADEDHKPRITQHRTGSGLSVVSYTHVCRHRDFCNDLSSSEALWVPPPVAGPGTLRCPLCLSKDDCPENAPEQVCPAGSTDCYSGILHLQGGGIATDLRVQGCMSQPGCDLLNGTQAIGPIYVREDCGGQLVREALKCQQGTLVTVKELSQMPLQWTAGQTTCKVGEGCQDTMMMIESGEQVSLVLTKGCTTAEDQEAKVTEHRTGWGLSVLSYTRVCRLGDFCNDLSTTVPLWAPPPVTAPGTMLCPQCLALHDCEDAPEKHCPAGSTHCYSGVVRLRGGDITSNLRVQGCMSQPGCSLLNGTQKIGPMDVSEDCTPLSQALTCNRGIMWRSGRDFAEIPVEWPSYGTQRCDPSTICQETLLLLDVGGESVLIGSRGCSEPGAQDDRGVHIYSRPPAMLVASYSHFCSTSFCNDAQNTGILLSSLPPPAAPAPGGKRCPACVQIFGACSPNSDSVTCPQETTSCYSAKIKLQGGGLSTTMGIQGCLASSAKSLLGKSKTIGIFSAEEISEDDYDSVNKLHDDDNPLDGASTSSPAWLSGLGLLLALRMQLGPL